MPRGEKLQLDAKQVAWFKRQLDSARQQIEAAGDGAANLAGSVLTCGMVLLVTDTLEGSEVCTNEVIEFLRRFPDCGLSGKNVEARAFEKSLQKRRHKMVLYPDHRWVYGKTPVPVDGGADGTRKRKMSNNVASPTGAVCSTAVSVAVALRPALTVGGRGAQSLQVNEQLRWRWSPSRRPWTTPQYQRCRQH